MADAELIVAARTAVASGQRNVARNLLARIVRADQSNGEAWYLLGQVLDDPAQKAECEGRAEAAGYAPKARRIVFPVDETPAPQPPQTVQLQPPDAPAEPQDFTSLRMAVAPEAAPNTSQPRRPLITIVLVIIVVLILAGVVFAFMQ